MSSERSEGSPQYEESSANERSPRIGGSFASLWMTQEGYFATLPNGRGSVSFATCHHKVNNLILPRIQDIFLTRGFPMLTHQELKKEAANPDNILVIRRRPSWFMDRNPT